MILNDTKFYVQELIVKENIDLISVYIRAFVFLGGLHCNPQERGMHNLVLDICTTLGDASIGCASLRDAQPIALWPI